jgi:hypothetical protein
MAHAGHHRTGAELPGFDTLSTLAAIRATGF